MTPPLWQKAKRNWRASWWKWKRRVKSWLKAQHSKTKIIASSPITSWQIDGETMETDFIFLGSKIIVDGDCSHEVKRCLLLGRKAMINLDSLLRSRLITFLTKVRLVKAMVFPVGHLVKAMVFPVVIYEYDSWIIKKAECWRTRAFELWCWRRLLRVPWTARRSNHSILKEISPEYSLEALWLKLKLQYFGHLMWRTDSLEKTLMLGKLKAGREEDDRGWDGWGASPTRWTWVWATLGVGDGQGSLACCSLWGRKELDSTERLNWLWMECESVSYSIMSDSLWPKKCSPPGSSVHGILQARIREWVAISFSRDLRDPGIEPRCPALQMTLHHPSYQGMNGVAGQAGACPFPIGVYRSVAGTVNEEMIIASKEFHWCHKPRSKLMFLLHRNRALAHNSDSG